MKGSKTPSRERPLASPATNGDAPSVATTWDNSCRPSKRESRGSPSPERGQSEGLPHPDELARAERLRKRFAKYTNPASPEGMREVHQRLKTWPFHHAICDKGPWGKRLGAWLGWSTFYWVHLGNIDGGSSGPQSGGDAGGTRPLDVVSTALAAGVRGSDASESGKRYAGTGGPLYAVVGAKGSRAKGDETVFLAATEGKAVELLDDLADDEEALMAKRASPPYEPYTPNEIRRLTETGDVALFSVVAGALVHPFLVRTAVRMARPPFKDAKVERSVRGDTPHERWEGICAAVTMDGSRSLIRVIHTWGKGPSRYTVTKHDTSPARWMSNVRLLEASGDEGDVLKMLDSLSGDGPVAESEAARMVNEIMTEKCICSNPMCPRKGMRGGLLVCSGCGGARYCGSVCQTEHWKVHRADCRKRKAPAKAGADEKGKDGVRDDAEKEGHPVQRTGRRG